MGRTISYDINIDGKQVVAPSPISLTLSSGEIWGENALLLKKEQTSVNEVIPSPFYKKKEVVNKYNQLKLTFKKGWVAMPEVEVHWYDGGMMPERPKGFPEGKEMLSYGGLTIFHGTKDTLVVGCYGKEPFLLSGRVPNSPKVCRRVARPMTGGHEMDWVRACKENPSSRIQTKSNFLEAGPFNEMVVMGVLAIRLQALNKVLEWDGPNMCFTNIRDNETIKTCIKDGFTINDGHPTFNKDWTEPVNAKQFAAELIKHNYRQGWKLVDMPR